MKTMKKSKDKETSFKMTIRIKGETRTLSCIKSFPNIELFKEWATQWADAWGDSYEIIYIGKWRPNKE